MRYTFLLAGLLLLPPQSSDKQAIAAFSKSMESAPADQRLAYNALQVAFATFREARLRHEVCLTAAPCMPLQAAEQSGLDGSFLALTRERGAFSPVSDDALAIADQTLNTEYERILGSLPDNCPPAATSCLSQTSFRDVERDWIRYRDAWVTFGTLHWPTSGANFWKVTLLNARSEQLKGMEAASR